MAEKIIKDTAHHWTDDQIFNVKRFLNQLEESKDESQQSLSLNNIWIELRGNDNYENSTWKRFYYKGVKLKSTFNIFSPNYFFHPTPDNFDMNAEQYDNEQTARSLEWYIFIKVCRKWRSKKNIKPFTHFRNNIVFYLLNERTNIESKNNLHKTDEKRLYPEDTQASHESLVSNEYTWDRKPCTFVTLDESVVDDGDRLRVNRILLDEIQQKTIVDGRIVLEESLDEADFTRAFFEDIKGFDSGMREAASAIMEKITGFELNSGSTTTVTGIKMDSGVTYGTEQKTFCSQKDFYGLHKYCINFIEKYL